MTADVDNQDSTADDAGRGPERPAFPLTPDGTVDWDAVGSQQYGTFVEYGAKPRISERVRGMIKRIRTGDPPHAEVYLGHKNTGVDGPPGA